MTFVFVNPREITSKRPKRQKKRNIFFLYRDEMMKYRPFKMPMSDYIRKLKYDWLKVSEQEKDRYRRIYAISRDMNEDNIEPISDANDICSEGDELGNYCCIICKCISENPRICNACEVQQPYQFGEGSAYYYGNCKLCESTINGNSGFCISCYDLLFPPQQDYSVFYLNVGSGFEDSLVNQQYNNSSSEGEGALPLNEIINENFINI
ncbi:hypothetical protein C1645_739079 [Glomus cerebriforme]|uniref:HMG box domain-containing protein n=1 Tax=Glomus cerebriforme TaxID=658196 RepID=A0A397T124_9GLOM|nr:hypothetical protein C1645_739079 [Glomus cerebriforme]